MIKSHPFEPNPMRAPKFKGMVNNEECKICHYPRQEHDRLMELAVKK